MIHLHQVSKSFAGQQILNELSLFIPQGQFCVLIGDNGCGKSTLLKLISGEQSPDSGSVHCAAEVCSVAQDINAGTVPSMTLLENMLLSKKPRLGFYSRFKREIQDLIHTFNPDLARYIDTPLAHLSGGQRQVVATLMAMHSGKSIILFDEHTSALDPGMQKRLMDLTARCVNELKLTALMVTHNMAHAADYGSRLIKLHLGNIVVDEEKNNVL